MRINIFNILKFFCAVTLIGISGTLVFGQEVNLALPANNSKVTAKGSEPWSVWETPNDPQIKRRVGGPAIKAIDGVKSGNLTLWDQTIVETAGNDGWIEVDLGAFYNISKIIIYPRNDTCCLDGFKPILIVTDQPLEGKPMLDDAKISYSSTYFKPFESPIKSNTTENIEKIGRYVRLQMKGLDRIELAEIEIFGDRTPVAGYTPDVSKAWNSSVAANNTTPDSKATGPREVSLTRDDTGTKIRSGVTAKQSSENVWDDQKSQGRKVGGPATKAIDGVLTGDLFNQEIVETNDQKDAWFEVDLGDFYKINKIVIHPRTDKCCKEYFKPIVIVADQPIGANPMVNDARIFNSSTFSEFVTSPIDKSKEIDAKGKIGRYVRLQIKGFGQIELAEIEIFGDRTPVAGYTPDVSKAWNVAFVAPFDPNYPNFQGATGEYERTLQASPKIAGLKNTDNSFDIAFQDSNSKLIRVNTYGSDFKKKGTTLNLPGEGVFGGFTKDVNGNRYIFTGTPWTNRFDAGISKVYKNDQVLWDGKFYNPAPDSARPNPTKTPYVGIIESFMHYGGSRLVIGKDSLLITTNIAPAHPYQVILDTKDATNKNKDRVFFESMNQHNFGQRAIFDGSDFVIMENRDHDVSVTLTKLNPSGILPLGGNNEGHANEYVKKIFSVYSHTNMNNNTYTELGNVEKGFGDNGYLVLFSSERDWEYKMTGYNYSNLAPNILSPRDIGLVHVKKDFDKTTSNWVNSEGKLSMCPNIVDNSSLVNSTGEKTTINYRSSEDGWDWAGKYNSDGPCKNNLGKDRTLVTKGVKWVTDFGASKKKAGETEEFTSVNHPKLVRIAQNKYVAVWEEWKAKFGEPKSKYVTTKAVLITLSGAANGEVNIESTTVPKDLGKIRLMPGDDAFEFEGKAAWAVGDVTKGKLMFYTVDASLNLASYQLEL